VAAAALELDELAIGTTSTFVSVAYSLHYVIAGRWTPGRKLWLSYALAAALFAPLWALNALWGGDCCRALLRRPGDAAEPVTPASAATL